MVLSKLDEVEYICVPGFQVHSERSLSLATTLVDVSGSLIEDFEHGDKSIRITIGTFDVTTISSDVVNSQSDTTSRFRDEGGVHKCLIDAFY
jgi:hypothetical protein